MENKIKIFLTELSTVRCMSGAISHYMNMFFENSKSYERTYSVVDSDFVFLFLEYDENFLFDRIKAKEIKEKKIIVFDYVETFNKTYMLGMERVISSNSDWIEMGDFCLKEINIISYFKREYKINNDYKNKKYDIHPLDFISTIPEALEYPFLGANQYKLRKKDLLMIFGNSNISRINFSNFLINKDEIKCDIQLRDCYRRLSIYEVFSLQLDAKLSVSLHGYGEKCFRDSESSVNSIILLQEGTVKYSYDWIDGYNCIKLPNCNSSGSENLLDCNASFDKVLDFFNKTNFEQSEVLFNCNMNFYNYWHLNYFENYLCPIINKYLDKKIYYDRIVCKNKKFSDIEGWFDYLDFYDFVFDKIPENGMFVEIGVWKGKSISYMAENIFKNRKEIKIFGVDTWKGSPSETYHIDEVNRNGGCIYSNFYKNIKEQNLLGKIFPMKMSSIEASKYFKKESLDCVFIDAEHTYESVFSDLRSWFLLVKEGGIISGHDYFFPEVRDAVDSFFKELKLKVNVMGNVWYLNKNINQRKNFLFFQNSIVKGNKR